MVQLDLRGLYWSARRRKDGTQVFYYRAWKGGPLILKTTERLRAATPELIAAYQMAHAATRPRADGFVSGLIDDYLDSPEWASLTPRTRTDYRRQLDRIRARFGTLPLAALDERGVRKHFLAFRDSLSATPRQADYAVSVLRLLLSFAVDRSLVDHNRAAGIGRLHSADKSHRIWTPEDIEAACAKAPEHVQWGIRLAACTGLRLGDLMALRWNEIKPDHIARATNKSRGRRVATIPLLAEAESLLATIPRRAVTVLTTATGAPWATGLGQSIARAAKTAGVARTTHDLRRTFATRLALAGLSDEQVAEVMGWSVESVAQLRRVYVDRSAVLRSVRAQIENKRV